mgnify:CR=1 FL=1
MQDYSFTECVFNHVYKLAGCRLDWDTPKSTLTPCRGQAEIEKYIDIANQMMNWNYASFTNETGGIKFVKQL